MDRTIDEKLDLIADAILALNSKITTLEEQINTLNNGVNALIEHQIAIASERPDGFFRQLAAAVFRTTPAWR